MSRPTDIDIDEIVDVLAKTDWRALGIRLKAAVDRDRRGGTTRAHDSLPTGQGGPGPVNTISRPVESAVLADYRTGREDQTTRVCPNGCKAPHERLTADDIEPGAPLEPGVYCTACSSLTVLRDADGPQGGGVFITARDPLRDYVERAWAHLQKIGVSREAFSDQLDGADELGDGAENPPLCEPCDRAGRSAVMGVFSDVGGRLPQAERLCLWHQKWLWRHNEPIATRGDDVETRYPATEQVHKHHATRTSQPAAKRTRPKPVADPRAEIADRRRKRLATP